MPSYSLPFSRPLVLAALFGLAGSGLAEGSELLLPSAENTELVERPVLRVTINASGVIAVAGEAPIECAGTCEVIVPALAAPLRAFHEREPEGAVLLVGDRRADFHDVRALLATMNSVGLVSTFFQASPEGTPLRALHLAQFVREGNESAPLIEDGRTDAPLGEVHDRLAPLLVTLSKEGVSFGRDWNGLINVPRTAEGALPLSTLEVLLAEDRRLHPSASFVIVNTNDKVAYGDMVTIFDRTRGYGYEETLAAGGPPTGAWGSSTPTGPLSSLVQSPGMKAPGGGDIHLGERDKSSIDAVIDEKMPSLRNCYTQTLGRKGSLAGTVMMKLVIAADGTISTATMTESTFADPGFEACALGVFDRLQFPPIVSGSVIVSYPFIFGPG